MRVGFVVRGVVQGVGFRPSVRRFALAHGLTGWVRNGCDGVRIEVQGEEQAIDSFARALDRRIPPPACIASIERQLLDEREEHSFCIRQSDGATPTEAVLPADLATCAACREEVKNPAARRHRYPFTNCARCGPRYSIVMRLPYDRDNTSMRGFTMCAECAHEYRDLDDRRHHAQPIACPRCGPVLSWVDGRGGLRARGEQALRRAVRTLERGRIVALQGLGGFQLLVDATDERAVTELRRRKRRPHKPFAVMFRDRAALRAFASPAPLEESALESPEAPILLLERSSDAALAEAVAPDCAWLGAMLPNTPLHSLLLETIDRPLVCTSGNSSEEPMCTTLEEALDRLGSIADGFLTHDRPIVRPVDDSVARLTSSGLQLVRRARGYAPRPVARVDAGPCVLAVGAQLKSTITLAKRGALITSQHLADLDAPTSRDLLAATVRDLCAFFDARPQVVACDLHPDYASTLLAQRLAASWGAHLVRVQHHHAHVAAGMAEHALHGEVLGLAWDGSGFGPDGSIWGGEALLCHGGSFRRFATVKPLYLPGGDLAAREPRRAAFGALFAHLPERLEGCTSAWFAADFAARRRALERGLNAPRCSSVGRLFDAVAALVGAAGEVSFEGQAAMALEGHAMRAAPDGAYPLPLLEAERGRVADPGPLFEALLCDRDRDVPIERMARRFHEALIRLGVEIAERADVEKVVLSGGCFQNRLLFEGLSAALRARGCSVYAPHAVPINDGGISVGQAWIAAAHARP